MRTVFLLASLALSFLASPVVADYPWTTCGTGSDHLKVANVTLAPVQPVRGNDQHVLINGATNEMVNGGTIHMTITYAGFLPVFDHTWNICDVKTCPVAAGDINVDLLIAGSSIPSISPPGSYATHTVATDQNGQELTCVNLTFQLN